MAAQQPAHPPPDGGGPVEDDPRAEEAVEDVDDGVPHDSPGPVVVLLALGQIISSPSHTAIASVTW